MAGGSDSGDWRSQLTPQNRTRVYHKIMTCLMNNCRISTPKEFEELQKIAVKFEQRMHTSASSKDDYVRKISAKLLNMEAHYKGIAAVNPSDPNPSAGNQIFTNEWNTSSLQGSAALPPSISQQQSQDELHFQKQIQNHLANQSIQHHSQLNTHTPHMEQEKSFSQKNQLQSSQQPRKQMSSMLQSGQSNIPRTHTVMTQSVQQHNAQHEQQNVIQHSKPSLIQPCPQSIVGQHHRQFTPHNQSNLLQQQSNKVPQQFVVPLDQQQQFVSQKSNVQQNHMHGKTNYSQDMQQQKQTYRRSSGQHPNIIHEAQQMQMTPVPLHQQLGPQGNISTTKKNQLLGSESILSSMPPNLHPVHMLPAQGQRNQQDHQSPQQQMIPQIQSHPQLAINQNHKSLQRAMLQNSGATSQSHHLMEHQNQPTESQVESSTTSDYMDIKITEGFSGAVDSQEAIYQKINFMKESYLAELSELHQKLKAEVNQVKSMPPKILNCTIGDMISVLSFMHKVASSDPENSSRVAVSGDLAAMTEYHLREHKSGSQEKFAATKRMKREISATCGSDTDELTETSGVKRKKVEVYHAIVEEIWKINRQLIDTVVSIASEDGNSFAALTGSSGGIIVKFSFTAVSLSESFRSEFTSGLLTPIVPLRLLVPADYPKRSPVVLDELKVDASKQSGLSVRAQMLFDSSIRSLVQPVSLRELARTWDNSVYKVIREYAEQSGGGSFSSVYGAWESCVAV